MAVEGPRIDLGYLLSTADLRNSTYSGSTRLGPNGSGQFLAVKVSTVGTLCAQLTTANGARAIGIVQNKPNAGEALDVTIFGVSKAVAGTTTITAGARLMADSSGALALYSSAADVQAIGVALEAPTAVGQIFSACIFGFGAGGGSIA